MIMVCLGPAALSESLNTMTVPTCFAKDDADVGLNAVSQDALRAHSGHTTWIKVGHMSSLCPD